MTKTAPYKACSGFTRVTARRIAPEEPRCRTRPCAPANVKRNKNDAADATGRIHDRTRTLRSIVRFLLHRGHAGAQFKQSAGASLGDGLVRQIIKCELTSGKVTYAPSVDVRFSLERELLLRCRVAPAVVPARFGFDRNREWLGVTV